jgi:quercetin dioxygenase-like cupin family protein
MAQHDSPSSLSSPQELVSLVQAQEGSVVSRVLLKKETGTVTLFAFAQGQGLSEHSTPHDAMVHVLEGSVEILIGGAPHRVSAGEALLLPANIPHALSAPTAFKMLLVMIREPAS